VHGQLAQRLRSLSLQPKGHPPTPRGNFWETRGRVGKSGMPSTKVAISLKRVKIDEKLLWRAYRNSPMLFWTLPSPTPYGLTFPKIWVCNPMIPIIKLQSLLSQERVKLWTSNLAGTFTGSIWTKAHEKFGRKGSAAYPGTVQIFWVPPIISGTGKALNFKFGRYIHRVHPNKSPQKIWEKRERGRIQGVPKFFEYPLLFQEWVKLQTSNFVRTFIGSIETKAH